VKRKSKLAIGAAVVLTAGAFVAATHGWANFGGAINARHVDLAAPDAYISTPALSRLPRDLVKAPLARDILTQDFAFYYEHNEERLALSGTLKRLAFEHDTTLADKLLQLVLDEPAEVALWKDDKGAPRYWLIAMTRGSLAKLAQNAAPLLAGDRQLTEIGDLAGARGATKVMALTLSSRRTYAIVARGDRVVILSDPGLLFDDNRQIDSESAKTVAALLSAKATDQGLYRKHFGLSAPGADHVLLADSSLLAFGYRHFFPGLQAVQIDVAPGGATLRTQLRVSDAKTLPTVPVSATLWSGMPMGPAACSWLPADWSQARALLDSAADTAAEPKVEAASEPASGASAPKKVARPKAPPKPGVDPKAVWDKLVSNLDGPAAVCWYARSQMHTPLLVAHLRAGAPPAAVDQGLEQLADWLMPGNEVAQPRAKSPTAPRRWQRDVDGLYGFVGRDSDYRPTLARAGAWVTYSPDDKLVDLALSAQERRYPSVGDTLPSGAPTLAVIAPKQVADLLQREAFAVLPAQQELFHQAAVTHLVPRLDALRRWPDVHAAPVGPPSAQGWVDVVWTSVVAAAPAPAAAVSAATPAASKPVAKGKAS
jgi:uncharacterized protein YfaA (DUF2138 family)